MFGGDLVTATRMMKTMAEMVSSLHLHQEPSIKKDEPKMTALATDVLQTGSNIIERINFRSWNDLGRDEVGRAISQLLMGIEDNALLLANAVNDEKIIMKPTNNISKSINNPTFDSNIVTIISF